MQIPSVIFERLVNSNFTSGGVVGIFKALEEVCQTGGGEIILSYRNETDIVSEDDLIPTITFALKPATRKTE